MPMPWVALSTASMATDGGSAPAVMFSVWPRESMADCVEISLQRQKLQLAFNEASCFYF